MRVIYEDKNLQRLAEDASFHTKQWGPELTRAFRKKVQILRNAQDERDLRNMRSLHFEQLKGDRAGTSSIRINSQFRLILRLRTDDTGRTVIIIEMVDYHR